MSQSSCSVVECTRSSRVLCHCCSNNYCIEHLRVHHEVNLSRLHQLTDDINELMEDYRGRSRQQLDRWRHESHQTIDAYYERKCQELDRLTGGSEQYRQIRQVIDSVKCRIAQFIGEQNVTDEQVKSLQAVVNAVRRDVNEVAFDQADLNVRPLIVDDHFQLSQSTQVSFALNATVESLGRTRHLSTEQCIVMARNSKALLIGQQSSLTLYDETLNPITQIPWDHGRIWDMCFFHSLSKFILLSASGMFTLDEQTWLIEPVRYLFKERQMWYCCAAAQRSLFLSTHQLNTTIHEYRMNRTQFSVKEHSISRSESECIEYMTALNDRLAVIILNNSTGARRFDVRSICNFHQLWAISLDIPEKVNIVSCCSLSSLGWLIVDLAQSRLIYVTSQGQLQQSVNYEPSPQYALQLNNQTLAVLTAQGINLHKLRSCL